jgi:cadmium resistance transport/sequestration family protein
MIQTIITSILAFVSTNIDDLFILMLFFGSRRYSSIHIFGGQYLGIALLVATAYAASLLGALFDTRYIGLLGLFPIYLAVKEVFSFFANRTDEEDGETDLPENGSFLSIAMVTIANGGDNIGVYVPSLATLGAVEKLLFVLVFMIMVAVWCSAAKYLAGHPIIAKSLNRYAHIAMPLVLFLLGLFILIQSNTFSLLSGI